MTLLPDLMAAVVEAADRHDAAQRADAGAAHPGGAGADRADHGRREPGGGDAASSSAVPARSTTSPRRSRRPLLRRWPALVGASAALAAAGLAAVLLVGTGDERLDVVAEARAALAPTGSILHLDLAISSRAFDARGRRIPNVGQAALTQHRELWIAGSPTRFRELTHESRERNRYDRRKPLQARDELAWADRAQTFYDAERNLMSTVTHLSPRSSASRPSLIGGVSITPDDLREGLALGTVADRGLRTVGGRSVRRFAGDIDTQAGAWEGTVTYDVDPSTYTPLRFTLRQKVGKFSWRFETTIEVRGFERIPLDDRSAQLLTIQPPPGTTIREQTLGEARAASRARRAAEEREARRRARTEARRP